MIEVNIEEYYKDEEINDYEYKTFLKVKDKVDKILYE